MVGIVSYGVHVPWYRMSRKTLGEAMGWFTPPGAAGEKAVANYDEDSLTLGVNAAMNCLGGLARDRVDGLFFATTSASYKLRGNAEIIATALDLRPDIRSNDFTSCTKAGTSAFLTACDTIESGSSQSVIVCTSDCRLAKPGSTQEQIYGDAAVALLLGKDDVIATLEGWYSLSYDFPDYWKSEEETFEHSWEERFSRDVGYTKFIPEAISGLLKKYNLTIKDFAKIIYTCPYTREHASIGKTLGAEANQIQDNMITTMGDSGTAYPLMMLIEALEDAKPGDRIMVVSYGGGSDALSFLVTDKIEEVKKKEAIKTSLALRKELSSYERYASFRDILPIEKGIRSEYTEGTPTQISRLWRQRRAILALVGSRCKVCGTPQYPPQRVCVKPGCGAIDQMEPYRFSDKKGYLFTYTADNLAFTINPPQLYGVVNFEGGGRFWFDLTDCNQDSLKVGMPLKMSFRGKYFDKHRGIHGYCWKSVPVL